MLKGLPEPHAKRSVEGDIGMRHCIDGIIAERVWKTWLPIVVLLD